ncbi:MAG: YigZ family protein [Oscillospiraceae bacterium]|nr:YigZ family protein [Oscillospiraceae bacterium]
MEDYRTVKQESAAEVEEKRSRFLAVLKPVQTEEEAKLALEQVRRTHHAARHHVYAWVLRNGGERCSDDGEPAQTAGMPVLEVLRHAGITDVILIVTRYFGGTLLGTGGLQRAYTAAAKAAVEKAAVVTFTACVRVSVSVPYALEQKIRYFAQQAGAAEEAPVYAEKAGLCFVLPQTKASGLAQGLQEMLRGGRADVSEPFYTLF